MKRLSIIVMAVLMVMSMAAAAFAADTKTQYQHGNPVVTSPLAPDLKAGLAADDATNDNGLNNANASGVGVGGQAANFNQVIKSDNMTTAPTRIDPTNPSTTIQRTHGEYQNNTNSCASCHQTHTASARNLLFKNSVYNTCTACHDGTLGFYNVFNPSTAGTFGGTAAGNASMHLANDSVNISAAPGGNGADNTEGFWGEKFSCNSCHTPHGSYSDRLLHFDPNGMADVVPAEGGNKVIDVANRALPVAPTAAGVTYAVYDNYATLVTANTLYTGPYATNNALKAGTASATAKAGKIEVIVTSVSDKNSATGYSWAIDTTPWFYEYEFDSAHKNRYYAAGFWKNTAAQWKNNEYPTIEDLYAVPGDFTSAVQEVASGGITIDHQNAFAYGNFNGIQSVAIGRVIVAKVPVVYNKLDTVSGFTYGATDPLFYAKTSYDNTPGTGTTPNIAAGTGISVSKFCAACHTDYMVGSGSPAGTFTQAYRHTTTSDSYMCLRCHFAHGTDVTVMKDSMDRDVTAAATQLFGGDTAKATAYMLDQNPSSALKRYTNMGVCWKCHTSSHSAGFKNTDYYKSLGFTGGTITTDPKKGQANASVIPAGF